MNWIAIHLSNFDYNGMALGVLIVGMSATVTSARESVEKSTSASGPLWDRFQRAVRYGLFRALDDKCHLEFGRRRHHLKSSPFPRPSPPKTLLDHSHFGEVFTI